MTGLQNVRDAACVTQEIKNTTRYRMSSTAIVTSS